MDKYNVVRKIGSGSFGEAELVQEKATAKLYLMKSIDIRNLDKKSRLKSHNEISILQNLNHPHITKYRESFMHSKSDNQPLYEHHYGVCRRRRSRKFDQGTQGGESAISVG